MPKTKSYICTCGNPSNFKCPVHGAPHIRASRKPEPQADLHPQTQMEATPRPAYTGWKGDDMMDELPGINAAYVGAILYRGECVAKVAKEHRDIFLRAVNSFDDLLEALKRAESGINPVWADCHSKDMEFIANVIANAERKP